MRVYEQMAEAGANAAQDDDASARLMHYPSLVDLHGDAVCGIHRDFE
jgi:hypothetical protein